MAFRGTTNEPASVTIAGKPATTTADNSLQRPGRRSAPAPRTWPSPRRTPSGNTRTNTYRVSASGAGATYTYDPNGNLTAKTEGTDNWVYTWNAENQLTKVEKNGAEIARFAYDAVGRRVEKVAQGSTSTYTYDVLDVIRETRGTVGLRYVHGPQTDEPLAAGRRC